MDPQATVHALLDAMARNDRVAVDEHLSNLKEWNMQGGFLPRFEKGMNAFVVHRSALFNTQLGVPYSVDYTIRKEGKLVTKHKTLNEALATRPEDNGKYSILKGHQTLALWSGVDEGWTTIAFEPPVDCDEIEVPGSKKECTLSEINLGDYTDRPPIKLTKATSDTMSEEMIDEIPGESGKCVMDHADVSNFQKQQAAAADYTEEVDKLLAPLAESGAITRIHDEVMVNVPQDKVPDLLGRIRDGCPGLEITVPDLEIKDERLAGIRAKAAQMGMTKTHAAAVYLEMKIRKVFSRLPEIKDERDHESTMRSAIEQIGEGWSIEDTVAFLLLTEEVNPDLEEDEALAKMAVILERNKKA